MGQAKNRGTLEERQAEREAAREARLAKYEADKAARWNAMSKAEQTKHIQMAGLISTFGGFDSKV